MEKLYSVPELAKYFNVSEKTIFRHLRSGNMKGFKVGREWFVTETNLNDFMTKSESKKEVMSYQLGKAEDDTIKGLGIYSNDQESLYSLIDELGEGYIVITMTE